MPRITINSAVASRGSMKPEDSPIDRQFLCQNDSRTPVRNGIIMGSVIGFPST